VSFRTVFALAGLLLLLVVPIGAAVRADGPDATEALRRVAGILDYIGGDYRGAVAPDGTVIDQGEYVEQGSLARDADALAAQAGVASDAPLRGLLAEIASALVAKAPPDRIAELCQRGRTLIVRVHGVQLAPGEPPSRDGQRLYAEHGCATCHGADGSAATEAASKLDPRPANFLDPERVATVSPHRAFYAISFGVGGTAMLGYPKLTEHERWSLAFHVLALRHARGGHERGRALVREHPEVPTDAARLSASTEDDLRALLSALPDAASRDAALAYLRAVAPFEPSREQAIAAAGELGGTDLSKARAAVDSALEAYAAGDVETARSQLIAAYLDGIEPYEAVLAARDRTLVVELERAMLALRTAVADRAPAERVQQHARALYARMDQAERTQGDRGQTAFWGALAIALREGLEVALLVGALLSIVRRRGQTELVPYVHGGWMLAVVGGLATYWLVGEALSGLQRELAEGIATLVAAVVLLGVTHWMIGQLGSRTFMGFVAERMQRAATSRRAALGILGLSFLAAYREALEVVLFFKALLLDAAQHAERVWLGAGAGVLTLLIVTFVLSRLGKRLPLRAFMLASSGLLALLAIALAGKGIRALQEAAVVPVHALELPELPLLGIYATVQGLAVQGGVALLLLASAVWPVLSARLDRTDTRPAE
jgi:high-affinity iron transporter